MSRYERCMCGADDCPSCGPPQGYGPLVNDLEPDFIDEDLDRAAQLRDQADWIKDQAKYVLPAPRCDLVVRTENDHWEVSEAKDVP